MEYRALGRTGLRVSPLCLGTMNFGPRTSEADSFAIMDEALAQGVNFFDTANVYGGGETETIVGRWFAQGGERREKVVLATKVFGGRDSWPNTSRLSARHIRGACEASLRRLQTDHIDLYQMHHVDRNTPWDEIWQAMDLLVAQGKVIYVGSSNFAGWHVAAAVEAARRRGSVGLVSEQSLYNLTARTVELEVLPACEAYGLGVLPWSPLAGGLLGGGLKTATEGRRSDERVQSRGASEAGRLEEFEKLCAELGHEPAEVALAWLLSNPVVTAPIVGPRTGEQFSRCLGALDVSLDADALSALNLLFPGPGGAAPEAYAW
jgi:aryl-alcohol dehydrogenase-like predicted oxidoreductase